MSTEEKNTKIPKENKAIVSEKERYGGKIAKAGNKARATAGKARKRNAGHEAVSDQKSHEYH